MDNRITIKIVLILALIASIAYLFWSSESYSCEKCKVSLINTKIAGNRLSEDSYTGITYNMSDLYEESKGGACPVYWDRVWGYRKA